MTEISTSWHSYGKIHALGHTAVLDLFQDDVIGEEKVDGSQFSFGIFNGELKCRSKGKQLHLEAPEKMFTKAVDTVKELAPLLKDGWTYRAEYLRGEKHNILKYNKTPEKHLIVFDISPAHEAYLSHEEKTEEAQRLGLEVVPILFHGKVESVAQVQSLLETESCLGGPNIEGVVFKNYKRFGRDGKVLMGKFVSEKFKEKHSKEWKKDNPSTKEIVSLIAEELRTEARWHKAVQHLRDNGGLVGSPRDIGKLVTELINDVREECEEEIKQKLFDYAWPHIRRLVTYGFPEWYKEQLAASQFKDNND